MTIWPPLTLCRWVLMRPRKMSGQDFVLGIQHVVDPFDRLARGRKNIRGSGAGGALLGTSLDYTIWPVLKDAPSRATGV